jgi:hypothetical protein
MLKPQTDPIARDVYDLSTFAWHNGHIRWPKAGGLNST